MFWKKHSSRPAGISTLNSCWTPGSPSKSKSSFCPVNRTSSGITSWMRKQNSQPSSQPDASVAMMLSRSKPLGPDTLLNDCTWPPLPATMGKALHAVTAYTVLWWAALLWCSDRYTDETDIFLPTGNLKRVLTLGQTTAIVLMKPFTVILYIPTVLYTERARERYRGRDRDKYIDGQYRGRWDEMGLREIEREQTDNTDAEWMSDWWAVSEWVSEWVGEWVSEWVTDHCYKICQYSFHEFSS